MADAPKTPDRRQAADARVDFLVNERGDRMDVPDNSQAAATDKVQRSIGATAPSNWWRIGLAVMAALILVVLALQIFGGAPGTDVQPGTPVAEPVVEPVIESP